jgi:hypothetical protein
MASPAPNQKAAEIDDDDAKAQNPAATSSEQVLVDDAKALTPAT